MKRLMVISALSGAALLAAAGALAQTGGGAVDLLPDPSLKGWTRVPWTAVDGLQPKLQWRVDPAAHTLICAGDGGHEWLRYDKEVGDFTLDVDWRFTPRGAGETKYNSGIGVRLSKNGEIWHQAQTTLAGGYLLGDSFIGGSIKRFNLMSQMKENRVKPAGEWNHYEIRAQGSRITLSVNGAVVSELAECEVRRGYVALEAEGFEITFRNIKLQARD